VRKVLGGAGNCYDSVVGFRTGLCGLLNKNECREKAGLNGRFWGQNGAGG